MKYLIINSLLDLEQLTDYHLFFIDTKFTNQYYERLLELLLIRPIKVYKRTNNIFAEIPLEQEREQIASGDDQYLEHYHQVDFMNDHLNCYLQITKTKADPTQLALNKFRIKKQLEFEQQKEHNHHLVFELYIKANSQLLADVELFHNCIDCCYLGFTSDASKYYSYQENLTDTDILISKSNKESDNNYFMLPQVGDYRIHQKLLYIKTVDYKQVINKSNLQEYIIDVVDDLKYSQFFNQLCKDSKLKLAHNIKLNKIKYNSQNTDCLLQIKLVEATGYLEIYQYENNQIKLMQILKKNSLEYQKMVLSYKNDILYQN